MAVAGAHQKKKPALSLFEVNGKSILTLSCILAIYILSMSLFPSYVERIDVTAVPS